MIGIDGGSLNEWAKKLFADNRDIYQQNQVVYCNGMVHLQA